MKVEMRWAAFGYRCPRCGVTQVLPHIPEPRYCPNCRQDDEART